MTDFILDASIVAKWLVDEPGSSEARKLISPDIYSRAPDLLVPELINIFWKKQVRGDMTGETAAGHLNAFLEDYLEVAVHLLPARILSKRALQIAQSTGKSAYDSLYLAAAVQAGCRLVTADERFARSIKHHALRAHIVALSDESLLI